MSTSLIFKIRSRERKSLFTMRAAVRGEIILRAESASSRATQPWRQTKQAESLATGHSETLGVLSVMGKG